MSPDQSPFEPRLAALAHQLGRDGQPVERAEGREMDWLLAGPWAYGLWRLRSGPGADLRELPARDAASREALRLNRRHAASLYQATLHPVWAEGAAPSAGTVPPQLIDHAVVMRRIACSQRGHRLLQAGRLAAHSLAVLARDLAAVHRAAAGLPADSPWGRPEHLLEASLDALDAPGPPLEAPIRRELTQRLCGLAQDLAPVWTARRAAGWVREGHGRLRLDHLVLSGSSLRPVACAVLDPAERWIDPVQDLAGLLFDLLLHGQPALAANLRQHMVLCLGQTIDAELLRQALLQRGLLARARLPQPLSDGSPRDGPDAASALLLLRALADPLRTPGLGMQAGDFVDTGCRRPAAACS